MHGNTSGVLLEWRGHTLTVDEGHAIVYGLLGLFIGTSDQLTEAIAKEPHYFLAGLVVSFLVGRNLRR